MYGTLRAIINNKQDAGRGDATGRRFVHKPLGDNIARLPAIDSEAMRTLRTLYPSTVRVPAANEAVLKSGQNSSKIGAKVLKGRWRGMPIYTLTLEERATCPVSCRHLRSCFGNKMQFARRFDHTHPDFERRLVQNIIDLSKKNERGFVIRLHVLGDFFSVRYVRLWEALLDTVPNLNVFGYTARNDDEIGVELRRLVASRWDRFAIRFSNASDWQRQPATLSIELPVQATKDGFVCPQQTGKTDSCGTCAACWGTKKRVFFLQH